MLSQQVFTRFLLPEWNTIMQDVFIAASNYSGWSFTKSYTAQNKPGTRMRSEFASRGALVGVALINAINIFQISYKCNSICNHVVVVYAYVFPALTRFYLNMLLFCTLLLLAPTL